MIGFSAKAKHTIAIMVVVATSAQQRLAVKDIAYSTGMSPSYVEQLVSRLKAASLLTSTRGPGGGYSLGKAADQISLHAIAACISELNGREITGVMSDKAADAWHLATASAIGLFQSLSLAELISEEPNK